MRGGVFGNGAEWEDGWLSSPVSYVPPGAAKPDPRLCSCRRAAGSRRHLRLRHVSTFPCGWSPRVACCTVSRPTGKYGLTESPSCPHGRHVPLFRTHKVSRR